MADGNKSGFFTKTVSKHAGRAKEKLLQNLGKADKTTDGLFDEYSYNFKRQETAAARLLREIKNYILCVKAMKEASKNLFDLFGDMYETDWLAHEEFYMKCQAVEMLWTDYAHKLNEQVLIPITTYQAQFPEIRKKIDKRSRKLVDYDGARHAYESLLNNPKKKDDTKIVKAKEQLEDSKRLFEMLNSELYDEIPALYDSRIPFVISNLQTIFTAEAIFHLESSTVNNELSELLEKLADENNKGTYNTRKASSPKTLKMPNVPSSPKGLGLTAFLSSSSYRLPAIARDEGETKHYEEIDFKKGTEVGGEQRGVSKVFESNGDAAEIRPAARMQGGSNSANPSNADSRLSSEMTHLPPRASNDQNHQTKRVEELYDIPVGATTDNLPPGVLYRVRATYKYACEDEDEISFEVGDIIQVVEYEDPEDQEEGWLVGVKESTGDKGLFPANFTRPI